MIPPPYNLTSLGGHFMRGVIVGWVPPHLPPPLNEMTPPITASKCPCPYVNRISEAFRIDVVHKSMLLRSTTKPPIFSIRWGLMTKQLSFSSFHEGRNRASV